MVPSKIFVKTMITTELVTIKVRMLFQKRFHPIVRIARAYKVRHANIGNGKDFF